MKPEDILKVLELLFEKLSSIFFKEGVPEIVSTIFGYVMIAILCLLILWMAAFVVSQTLKYLTESLAFFRNEEKRRRCRRQQQFAEHIEQEIRQLNRREEWKDYRFAELEAEVEAEGRRKGFSLLPFYPGTREGLRHEQSLSKALENSCERLIAIEGDPGAGKSIALRFVASKLARRAANSKNIKSTIPIYLNLKKLARPSDVVVDRRLIESFVQQELNRVNDRDVEQFLDDELQRGIEEGTWLFLFDSFDEIPEVLSSVESDETTRQYAEAVNDFLSGFSKCRGIIASRRFRGPKHLNWAQFRILPLEARRWLLIRKAELPFRIENDFSRRLKTAPEGIQDMTKNPMFLGILCENMRDGSPFPDSTHGVLEKYLDARLTRDSDRLKKRFNLEPSEVRVFAERVAFCMLLDSGIGLSPTRADIRSALRDSGFTVPYNLEQLLDAIEYLKLARAEADPVAGSSPLFTFSHRRFQEYFATCVVLNDLKRISLHQLLLNGRWRETTVVIFQTQSPDMFLPILEEAQKLLSGLLEGLPNLINNPAGFVNNQTDFYSTHAPSPFARPNRLFHLLGLLQDGFVGRMKDLPEEIQTKAASFLLTASIRGTLSDKISSLKVAGVVPQPILLWLLRSAFSGDSKELKKVAYRQAARLSKIPPDVSAGIRKTLLRLLVSGRISKERFATQAHLSQLDKPARYLNVHGLLRLINPIEVFSHAFIFAFALQFLLRRSWNFSIFGLVIPPPLSFLTAAITVLFLFSTSFSSFNEFLLSISSKKPYHVNGDKLDRRNIEGLKDETLPLVLMLAVIRFTIIYGILKVKAPLALAFPLLWPIFAIFAADGGDFAHPSIWLFLILFPFLNFVLNFKEVRRDILQFLRGKKKVYKSLFAWAFFQGTLLALLIFFEGTAFLLIYPLVSMYAILLLIPVSKELIQEPMIWIQDWLKWKSWLRNDSHSAIEAHELLTLFNQYHNDFFCRQTVKLVREKNTLLSTKVSKQILTELIVSLEKFVFFSNRIKDVRRIARGRIERSRTKKEKMISFILSSFEPFFYPVAWIVSPSKKSSRSLKKSRALLMARRVENYSGSADFTEWLKHYTLKDKNRFASLGSEFLDEAYLLLEQLRNS